MDQSLVDQRLKTPATTARRRKQRSRPTQWDNDVLSQDELPAHFRSCKEQVSNQDSLQKGITIEDVVPLKLCQTASTEEEEYDDDSTYQQPSSSDDATDAAIAREKLQRTTGKTSRDTATRPSLSRLRERFQFHRRRRRRSRLQQPPTHLRRSNHLLEGNIFLALLVALSFVILVLLWTIYVLLSSVAPSAHLREFRSVSRLGNQNKWNGFVPRNFLRKRYGIDPNDVAGDAASANAFGKPFKDLTYRDIPFEVTSPYWDAIPSCDDSIEFDDIDFTLVTQVSEDRLWMLTQHCQRWPGKISAAVFTDKEIPELHEILEKESEVYNSPCKVDQIIFSTLSTKDNQDRHHTSNASEKPPYPVNSLRNLALSRVSTTHFMYVDIDFWVSSSLYNILQTPSLKQALIDDPQLALVIPAFQLARNKDCQKAARQKRGWWWKWIPLPRSVRRFFFSSFNQEHLEQKCRMETIPMVPDSFEKMVSKVLKHQASVFDPTNRGGHGSTSYRDWIRMEDGELQEIPCIQSNRYEPYVAARWCDAYPPYQEVFTGYGKNKMTQIMQMRQSGYVFHQVGGAFVCHYPHPPAKSRSTWIENGKKQHKLMMSNPMKFQETYGVSPSEYDWTQFPRGQVDKLFFEYREWLDFAVPSYRSRTPMCEDWANDDAALWLNANDRPPGWYEQYNGSNHSEEEYVEGGVSRDSEGGQPDDDSDRDNGSVTEEER